MNAITTSSVGSFFSFAKRTVILVHTPGVLSAVREKYRGKASLPFSSKKFNIKFLIELLREFDLLL